MQTKDFALGGDILDINKTRPGHGQAKGHRPNRSRGAHVIKNERQNRISKAELRRFEESLEVQRQAGPRESLDPRLHEAMGASLQSEIDELREQLARYEDLRAGRVKQRELQGFLDLLPALVEARIAAGLTQRALAERLGLSEQQVQRWEANLYSGVGLERLQEVADALGMESGRP